MGGTDTPAVSMSISCYPRAGELADRVNACPLRIPRSYHALCSFQGQGVGYGIR